MGLPSSPDGIADSDSSDDSDATRNEKLLRTELDGVKRGEALDLIGAFKSFEAAGAPGLLAESSSEGPISNGVGRCPANLVTSDAEDVPT